MSISSASWWARKLGAPAPAPSQSLPSPQQMPPSQYPMTPAAQLATAQDIADMRFNPKLKHLQGGTGYCPQCGSGNFFEPQGADTGLLPGQAAHRCYDCGYAPGRNFAQSSSYDTMPSSGATSARPVKQPVRGTGFNPGTIVGRV